MGFGRNIESAKTVAEAIEMAGMNWKVKLQPAYRFITETDGSGLPVGSMKLTNFMLAVRDDNGQEFGAVTPKYKPVQNSEAFDLMDELVSSEGAKFSAAGTYNNGSSVWIRATLPKESEIVGDKVQQNLVFVNSHNGKGGIRVFITPVRVVCSNALNVALRQATQRISITHTGDVEKKLDEVRRIVAVHDEYMDGLREECEEMQRIKLTDDDVQRFIHVLYPSDTKQSERKREELNAIYYGKDDLSLMGNTGLHFLNAVSDQISHSQRGGIGYRDNLYGKIIGIHSTIEKAHQLVMAA